MTRKNIKVTAAALALAAVTGASADSCATNAAVPECQVTTVAPSWAAKNFSTDGTGLLVKKINPLLRVVQGTLWARCLIPPKSHVLDMGIYARPQNSVGDLTELAGKSFKNTPGTDWTPYTLTAPFITGDYEIRYTVFVTNSDGPQPPEGGRGYRASFTIEDW